jgi:hypothetical protein
MGCNGACFSVFIVDYNFLIDLGHHQEFTNETIQRFEDVALKYPRRILASPGALIPMIRARKLFSFPPTLPRVP